MDDTSFLASLNPVVAIILALVLAGGSGALGVWIDRSLNAQRSKKESRRVDGQVVLDRLETLRATYQKFNGTTPGVNTKRDLAVSRGANALVVAVAKTADIALLESARTYIEVGEAWSAGSYTTILQDEENEFLTFVKHVMDFIRKNR